MEEFKSFFKTVGGNEGDKCKYPHRLDTYGCGCQHDCKYCVSPDTQILMFDGSILPISEVDVGEAIYGIVEGDTYKTFTKSVVLAKSTTKQKAYKITLSNGTELICSGNHQWLTNRGWKFTVGDMSGESRRPYITTKNQLLGFYSLHGLEYYTDTDDYKLGYLRGVILGDANLAEYHYGARDYRGSDDQYHFRLALKNELITEQVRAYLSIFGVDTDCFEFPMVDRSTKETYSVTAIRTQKRENYDRIKKLISKRNTEEFKRGFLAGIYDAEGTNDILIRRIHNSNLEIIADIEDALTTFGFEYTFDKDSEAVNVTVKTIRLVGGLSESLRFNHVTQCLVTCEDGVLSNIKLKSFKSSELKIVSIEEYADEMELVDITTTTRNFIANGVVSHNCYAKSLLDFRGLWNPTTPSVADIEKIRKKIASIAKKGEIKTVRLGGMTDCFQPLEKIQRVTYETIKALNEARISYLIVTKSDMVADDEYIAILDKDLAHIQITVTTTNDELSKTYEKAVVPSRRIKAIEKLQKEGFDVALRLSPFIDEYIDYDVLNAIKCDKIQVEFLRVNSWIKKWFNIDYSKYTIKQSNYRHLPLYIKKELLKKITGFKEISVCEDETLAYEYWRDNVNPNPDDCCNLRRSV